VDDGWLTAAAVYARLYRHDCVRGGASGVLLGASSVGEVMKIAVGDWVRFRWHDGLMALGIVVSSSVNARTCLVSVRGEALEIYRKDILEVRHPQEVEGR